MTDLHKSAAEAAMSRAAGRHVELSLRAGAATYLRDRDLPALIRLDLRAACADDEHTAGSIVARLDRALRSERKKARAGDWTYDLNRHIALRQAHRAEVDRLEALCRAGSGEGERRQEAEHRQQEGS